ncbi:MAG: transcriptional repressor NrdR [Thermoanaerobacteraceae bacterium]|jgi:transcriptional repressor NrdR|uniref:Transcriptional repressor NrdR n=1 Tax=Biomaibacter acetigenes TaxID=2316383 RepID=A0A3G2R4J2_9FIRM|nr:transcriptional regulator NrdR [Biomaibacter acetigenes]MDK2877621.1 transcriptional repressor NrdR [Thermoanaerobacteraceae bacterium]RKL63123.1 transcriptional repressor NrdR [Thermoanaerobacteraceae bacterium SP2]AYO30366.1 transcriptional repressor NrdR [Biomaibacter acetigenes]MDN5300531.1 transcriptional repressor NrdR [Thermoanaerobacteraceae bacterium]MDN5311708.1 transcriptional repressor NrdR [Thermoanaerobacteraceae bacterium]
MKCPFCGYLDSKVMDSRPTDEGSIIRRRRECPSCKKRFTTYERIDELPIMVIKKSGNREVFDPHKIINGLIKACEKRPVTMEVLQNIAYDVEKELKNSMEQEVESRKIGEMVMKRLKNVDEVAYVRFASVYRQFKDINSYIEEIKKLQKQKQE